MPVSAIELVKKLMAKAGVTHDGDLTTDIPDEVATALDNSLLTVDAALNNHPTIKKKYFAEAYNGIDSEFNSAVTEFGLADDVVAEIKASGGSVKRIVALARKVKELSAKTEPADKGKAAELQAEINKLHNQLADEIKKQGDIKAEFDKQIKDVKIKQKLDSMVGAYKTMYDELPAEAKEAAITALINKSLQDSDADFTFDEKGNLSLVKKDGTNLFGENHTLITPQSFIDKSLSKILKVTTSGAAGGNIANPQAQPLQGGQNSKNAALDAAIADSLQNYTAATKQAVAV